MDGLECYPALQPSTHWSNNAATVLLQRESQSLVSSTIEHNPFTFSYFQELQHLIYKSINIHPTSHVFFARNEYYYSKDSSDPFLVGHHRQRFLFRSNESGGKPFITKRGPTRTTRRLPSTRLCDSTETLFLPTLLAGCFVDSPIAAEVGATVCSVFRDLVSGGQQRSLS